MFIPSVSDASASTAPATSSAPTSDPSLVPNTEQETIRHLLFGSPSAVRSTIQALHKRGYANVNDWSPPQPTGKPDEVVVILTKRMRLEP